MPDPQLLERRREVLRLVEEDGLDPSEVATRLRLSRHQVRRDLIAAREVRAQEKGEGSAARAAEVGAREVRAQQEGEGSAARAAGPSGETCARAVLGPLITVAADLTLIEDLEVLQRAAHTAGQRWTPGTGAREAIHLLACAHRQGWAHGVVPEGHPVQVRGLELVAHQPPTNTPPRAIP
ncbi:sigma-70 family RNA polymerase sigma factor, partial [Streptomyces calidiresistens]